MSPSEAPVTLLPETREGFRAYIREAEAAMDRTLASSSFLWCDARAKRAEQVLRGRILAQFWAGEAPVKVPHGLIHDWVGAALIPDTNLEDTLALVQDYNNHQNIYKPEVIASRLISQHDNDFEIYMRLLKKKILTVVLDTDHEVHYRCIDEKRWECRSYTTRIAEVEHAGTPQERVMPPDSGFGFLWRLYSYWRFQEKEEGVCLECRAISLTRDLPFGLGWIIEPIVQTLPRESLIHTLEATRQALRGSRRVRAASLRR